MNVWEIIFAGIVFFAFAMAMFIAMKQMTPWLIPIAAIVFCIVVAYFRWRR